MKIFLTRNFPKTSLLRRKIGYFFSEDCQKNLKRPLWKKITFLALQDCSEDANLEQKTEYESRCSSENCVKCKFTIPVLDSKRETTLSISVEFLDEQYWKRMVRGKERFWIGGVYEVKEADYKTETNKFPRNKKVVLFFFGLRNYLKSKPTQVYFALFGN